MTLRVGMVGSATMIESEVEPLRLVRRAREDGSSVGSRPSDPSNHEQPITAWTDQLHAAGFELAEPPQLLFDYWWAPAYLLHATPWPVAAGPSPQELHV